MPLLKLFGVGLTSRKPIPVDQNMCKVVHGIVSYFRALLSNLFETVPNDSPKKKLDRFRG